MANTATIVQGPTGQSGPNAAGEFAEETWRILGDNTSATMALSAQWLRQIDSAFGNGANNVVINNTVSPPTATLTFPANLGAGAVVFAKLQGRR